MMGKPTGFMEFKRLNKDEIKVEERIKDVNNFFNKVKERDNKLINNFIYGRLDIYNRH